MPIFFPPIPPVFTGGVQPYGPAQKLTTGVQVDNPPFTYGGPRVSIFELAGIAQPNPWVYAFFGAWQPFAPKRLNPDILGSVINDPPFTYGGPVVAIQELANIAQPDPWVYRIVGAVTGSQPYGQRQLNPSITAVPEDNPPFTYGGPIAPTASIINAQQPNSWVYGITGTNFGSQPYGRQLMAADLVANPANNPPFKYAGPVVAIQELANIAQPNPWQWVIVGGAGGRQPYAPKLLTPTVLAVQVDNPPFAERRRINTLTAILVGWQLSIPPEQLRRPPYRVALTLGYTKGYIIT